MRMLLGVFARVLSGSRILLGRSYKLYGGTRVVLWRDAYPKQLRDEVKVQRPVGCSRYVAGFERCSPRGDCVIELAESARGASAA
jgi:hypothetical protein